jgi:hypothetical protein
MVKMPEPVHPTVVPVKVHLPVMVLPFTLPCRVSTFTSAGDVVEIVRPNVPVTFPLKFPPIPKEPVSVVGVEKQDEFDTNWKLVTVSPLLLAAVRNNVNAKV